MSQFLNASAPLRLLAGACVVVAILAPFQPTAAQTYAAGGVDVVHAAAIVHVISEARDDISINVTLGRRLPAPRVTVIDGRVVINGGLDNRIRGCGGGMFGNVRGVTITGVGAVHEDELPVITIHAPQAVDLTTDGAVYADIGAMESGRLRFNGCGAVEVASARGALNVDSGGSGHVRVGNVGGVFSADLRGSGGVDAAAANGANLRLAGSGSLALASVRGPLSARVAGSGALRVGSAASEAANLELSGSGGILVDQGDIERLDARLSGSGGIRFGGRAAVLNAQLSGSGGISIAAADHVENLIDNGSGGIHVGNQ